MGDVLRNSVSVIVASDGLACKYYSFTRSRHGSRLYCRSLHHRLNCGLAVKTERQAVLPRMDESAAVLRIHSRLDCKGGERDKAIERGEEEICIDPPRENLPPSGDFTAEQGLSFELHSDGESCAAPENMNMENEDKLHFLEETNEEILSRRVLALSRSNKVKSALELFRSMKLSGLQPNVHASNSLLSCLLRNGLFDKALSVFEFMRTSDITTSHTYSLILKAVASAHGSDSAVNMFAELERNSKQEFDVIVYNTMISISGRVKNLIETERIWRSMKDNGHIGTEVTYSLLISIFVRCGENDLALDAYNEMIRNGLPPSDDVMHATISACTKEGKWDLALKIFEDMLNDRLKPNSVACNALINSLGKAGKVELAFKVYGIMKFLGHAADEYTRNALLSALYRANRHADVLQLFYSIKRGQHSQLNVHLYNTALMSCQKLGSWEKALQLLWQMEASGLSVSTSSYNLVIGACETARKPKVALQVYERMIHQKCTPDTFTHLSLLRSCIWGSLWDEVEEILNWVAPNVSLYNAAIHGMCLRGKFKSAEKLYMRMREVDLKPDGKTRALMLQNLWKDSK